MRSPNVCDVKALIGNSVILSNKNTLCHWSNRCVLRIGHKGHHVCRLNEDIILCWYNIGSLRVYYYVDERDLLL